MRHSCRLSAIAVALLAITVGAADQATAQNVVAGVVVGARNRQPLPGVRVLVEATGLFAVTDAAGRFHIENVVGVRVSLSAQLIGYRAVTLPVSVGATDIQLVLAELIINLDEIVVTGTAGETQRRAVGNTVAKIATAEIQAIAPTSDMFSALKAQAPSVHIRPSGGGAGEGGQIRIRGVNSLSLNNEPLIYVDGVRVDNSDRGIAASSTYWQGAHRLNDIPVQEIESIEIIKGSAAATLYGTEASNGVIQIITKRGRVGRPRVNVSMQQGANWVPNPGDRMPTMWSRLDDGSFHQSADCALPGAPSPCGFNAARNEALNGTPIFTTGHVQRYGVDVTGGSDELQYFIGAGWEEESGTVQPSALERFRLRTNLTAIVSPQLQVTANLGYSAAQTDYALTWFQQGGGGVAHVMYPDISATGRGADGRGFGNRLTPSQYRFAKIVSDNVDRFTGGVTIRHEPSSWFSHRFTVGADYGATEGNLITERQTDLDILAKLGVEALGLRVVNNRTSQINTIDYAGSVNFDLTDRVRSKTSVGLQYYRQYIEFNEVRGEQFPGPGVTAVNAAAVKFASGTFSENITVGTYVQQQFSLNDRLYLTAAIRADDNSAFGEDFDLVTYPKFGAAWVMSEEPFWPFSFINTFRVRGAYGQSGKQPISFAALRVFQPMTAPGDQAGVRPLSVGNPELGPERSEEYEIGFEAGLFDDRIGIDFNYYNKRTSDLILNRNIPPSAGFPGSQPVNIGEVTNTGIELMVTGVPIDTRDVRLELMFTAAQNSNLITDMGGVPPLNIVTQQAREGFPVLGFFGRRVISADVAADPTTGAPIVTNVMCDGGTGRDGVEQGGSPVDCATAPDLYHGRPTPEWEGAITTNLTLFNRLTLYGMIDYQVNVWVFDWNIGGNCASRLICATNQLADSAMAHPVRAANWTFFHFGAAQHPDRSFARVRQISASYSLPQSWVKKMFGASSASVTLSARNLWLLWTRDKFGTGDPDIASSNGANQADGSLAQQYYINFVPTPLNRQFVFSLRIGF